MVVMRVMMMVMKVMVALNITEGITPQGGLSQRAPGGAITEGKKTQVPLSLSSCRLLQ